MKKSLLTLLLPLLGLPVWAQEEASNPTPSESLDFTVDGIVYTILNEQEKTCQTKAGYSYIDYEQRKLVFAYGNSKTGDVNIPATVQKDNDTYTVVAIGSYGFDQASSVTIAENGVTTINEYAFMEDKNLTSVSIPDAVSYIGRNAFFNCTSLTNITLPNSLSSIEPYTFSYSAITSVEIPSSVINIGENAFAYCTGLQSVTIPSSVMQLGKSVFQACSGLNSLTIEEGITSIPANAFSGCNNLTTLTIPGSVNSIGDYGFNCSGLTTITCYSRTLPVISSNSFNSANYSKATLQVYKTVLTTYQSSLLWGQFVNILPIEEPATSISISPSTLNINVGLTGQLTAVLTPEDATGEVVWNLVSASPANCIEVDLNGLVTAKQIGTGRVSATCGTQLATCDIVVTANPDESVVINPPGEDIYIGDTLTLSAAVFPTTITPSLTWSSSNTQVATIDSKTGALTALSEGGTVITATNDNVSGTIALTVKPIEASSITLDQQEITLKVGGSQTLMATILPENTTYKTVSWDSNDPSVAVVSDGVVTAMGIGTANVRAMTGQVTANCTVTVEPIEATNVTLNATEVNLKIGQSTQLFATVGPENTTYKTIEWTSSNAEFATVTTDGEIIAIAQGTTIITATCGSVSASCTVTVSPITSEELVMNYTSLSLNVGSTQQLSAAIYPEDTTDQTITWSSSNDGVATVENGLVTAIGTGTATITAQNGDKTATCDVTVNPVIAEVVILDKSSITVNVGMTESIAASVLPENTTDKTIEWTSLNPEIVTISDGIITGMAPGSTVITASCGIANSSCIVNVLQPATSITLNKSSLDLFVGDMFDLIETVMPENTTDIVSWSSSDENVAIVNQNGIVSAIKAGQTAITVKCGEQSAQCEVTVSDIAATSVSLDYSELTLKKGQVQQLTATVLPENTTNPVVIWESSNPTVATVAEDGTVTALTAGTTSITATCGDVFGTCELTVEDPEADEVVLNILAFSLKAEEAIQLEVINPENVITSDITWSSSNTKVATVSETGLVTAVNVGEAEITAIYNGISATCVITVVETPVEMVELNYTSITLEPEEDFQLIATVYPSTATETTVVWTSSNPEVATVSEEGVVIAIAAGSAVVTAECGNVYAMCGVTVRGDETSAIKSILSDNFDGYYRVYNLQGVQIMKTTEITDLKRLIPGLYIINGKKVGIR